MTSIDSKLKDLLMADIGICIQCGTFNNEHQVCNCANKELAVPSTSLFPTTEVGMKFDTGKLLYSLIPPETLKALAEVLTFGAQKYAPGNWAKVDNGEDRYLNALFRHLEAYRAREDFDSESKLSHLAHCMCNIAFLHHFQQKRLSGI